MIRLESVSKKYGAVTAVDDVSLKVNDGSVFGVIGKSGAGKSSLLRIMSLLERPDAGQVLYDGRRADALDGKALLERRRKMGMIFQNFNLFSSRDVRGNVGYPLEIAGVGKPEAKKRVGELLDMVGIADKSASRLSELSGGQKQRVAIARALASRPDVLFCDEATSALDPQTTRSILTLIRDVQKQLGITVVLITHQVEVVRWICEEVAVMDGGRIVESGRVENVLAHPQTDAAREFARGIEPAQKTYQGASR
jgi:D-methionine transport system ATP-binding protein